MRVSSRFVAVCALAPVLSAVCLGQAKGILTAGARPASPGYARRPPVHIGSLPAAFSPNSLTFNAKTGALIGGGIGKASIRSRAKATFRPSNDAGFAMDSSKGNRPTIDGLDTLATFDRAFIPQSGPETGFDFRFTMIGNDPREGGTTVYPGNIDEVSLKLLNPDGTVFKVVPFQPFDNLTLQSPNFTPLDYRSGHHIEFADAVHRAEFYNEMKNNWHTLLLPQVVNRSTITVPYYVTILLQNGSLIQARTYFTGQAGDGQTYVLMLDLLFELFFENEVINDINLGYFTTDGLNTTMFPNTFLFSLNASQPDTPGSCCVLGFHTYFLDTSTIPEPRWVTQYASWISPGLFGSGFEDVTALSHETSESFADPFVDNPTPVWQFPGVAANARICQANLEDADPIEGLSNATAPTEVKGRGMDFIYHPQNIAMYQWFEMGKSSGAIDGTFSFPDETVLTHSALPCP